LKKVKNKYHFEVGDITYITPEMPAREDLFNYGKPKKEQRWSRELFFFPDNMDDLDQEEKVKHISADLSRRINGVWIFINAVPTYIAGDHYFYLMHWWMGAETQDGYPEYRNADLLESYFWDFCEKDSNCIGEIHLTNKRSGKTEKGLCRTYNKVSIYENKHGALQSLTGKVAKQNLFDRVIRSWERMDEYIKPVDEGIYPPKTALRFFPPSKRTTKTVKRIAKKAIRSWIDFQPTKADALQGMKPFRVLLDEPGTVQEMDLMEWFTTTKQQCVLGKKIVGKIILPTTIENLSSNGSKNFIELWNKSDYNNLDANSQTQSGLYRFFKPSYVGHEGFIDEFGNDMMTPEGEYEAKIFLQNKFDAASSEDRVKLKRQYPFTVEDAFDSVASEVWEEDVKSILREVRTKILNDAPPILYTRIFKFGTEIKHGEAHKDTKGVVKIYEKPKENVKYKAGFDGAGSDLETGDVRGSKVAFIIMKAFEGIDKENYLPVATYSERPQKMEEAYQTIFLLCEEYGQYENLEVLGESNAGQASPVVAYFGNRGGLKYIMKKPKNLGFNYNEKTDKYWIYRNDHVKDLQKILANQFIRRYGHNIKHIDLVEDLIKIGKENTDEADAFLMAVLALGDFDKVIENKNRVVRTSRQVRTIVLGADGVTRVEWVDKPYNQ